jgi:N-glycosylase/DNA lyase
MIISSKELNIDAISNSGQCFRWKKISSKKYVCPTREGLMVVEKLTGNILEISGVPDKYIKEYFNLDLNYEKIIKSISFDPFVKIAIDKYYGLRVLNQDLLETIYSFMLSQNNTVLNVSRCIERISKTSNICLDKKENIYQFPDIYSLEKLHIKDFEEFKCGYRSKYLHSIPKHFKEVRLNSKYNADKLRSELLKFSGIGEKVADCILLYSLKKHEVVPMDTWIEKATKELYGLKGNLKNRDIRKFYEDRFGEYAGWAHLFIFHYARMNQRKNKSILECFNG